MIVAVPELSPSQRTLVCDAAATKAAGSVMVKPVSYTHLGLRKNIPVIKVNLPNDGGVTGNPFFVVMNPTLKTQCEGIYKHIQKNYSLNPIVVFRRKGQLEDRIKSYVDDFGKSTVAIPLQFKYVDLTDSFTVNQLKPCLLYPSRCV